MKTERLVLGMFGTNCYIVEGKASGRCVLVDPADRGRELVRHLLDKGLTPEAVLLTHGHYDHILAVPALQEQWPALPVYVHPLDCPKELVEYDMGQKFPTVTSFANVKPLKEGMKLSLAGVEFAVLETPGHTPGSVTFLAEDVLFTGDTLFAGSIGRTDFAGGDDAAMFRSLKRLAQLPGDYRVLAGHEGTSTLEQERKRNPYLRAAARR